MHKHYIDWLRALATLGVITIHVTVHFYSDKALFPGLAWWLANGLNAASRCCVPLFVMISGALLLQKVSAPPVFYRKRLLRLLPPLLFWNVAYAVLEAARSGNWTGLVWFLRTGLWVAGEAAPHLWYLSMLVCLMAITPFLALFVHGMRPAPRDIGWLMLVLVGFGACDQLAALLAASRELEFNWYQRFPGYMVYLLAGHYLDRSGLALGVSNVALGVGLVLLLSLGMTGNYWLASEFGLLRDWLVLGNTMPLSILFTAGVFLLVRRNLDASPASGPVSSLAECSFGIYLIHPLFIMFISASLPGSDRYPVLAMLATLLLTLVLSLGTVWGLRRHAWFRMVS